MTSTTPIHPFDSAAVLDNVPDPVMVLDTYFRHVYANAAAENLLGRPRDQILTKRLWEVLPETVDTAIESTCRRAMTEQIPITFETFYHPRNIWAEIRLFPTPATLTVFFRDITERRQTLDALRESQAGLADAQRIAHIGSWQWDITRDTAQWSEETFGIFGMPPLGLQYHLHNFVDLIVPDDRERVSKALADAVAGTGDYKLDYRIRLTDGTEKWIHAEAELVRDADGRPTIMRGTVQDITERKCAEGSLKESQAKVAAVFPACPAAIAISRLFDGMTLETNDALQAMLGYTREELIGHTAIELELWGNLADRNRVVECLSSTGAVWNMEVPFRARGNRPITVQFSAVRIDYAGGPCMICSFVDITQRKAAEEHLRQSQQRFAALSLATFEGVAVSENGRILDVNEQFSAIFDYMPDELIGMEIVRLVAPDALLLVEAQIRERREEAIVHSALRRDGTQITVEAHGKNTTWQGRPARITAVQDITQRQRAQEALRESEGRYRSIFENSIAGIYRVSPAGKLITVNPALAALFGFASPEEMLNHVNDAANQLYVNPRRREDLWQLLRAYGRRENFEVQALRKNGSIIWVSLNAHVVRDAAGEILYAEGYNIDITQRKLAEDSLAAHQAQLRSLAVELSLVQARERRELAQYLHDSVGQDLAMARLQLQLLKRPPFPPDAQDLLAKARQLLERAIDRSRSLTFQLSPPALYEIGLKAALAGLVEELRKLYPLEIELVMSRRKFFLEESRRVLLFRAVRELLLNVVKHAHASHAVLTVTLSRGQLSATVVDDGIGFNPAANRSHAGFGLFSVREQLEALGGTLKVASTSGKGSQITIVLPHIANPPANPGDTP